MWTGCPIILDGGGGGGGEGIKTIHCVGFVYSEDWVIIGNRASKQEV